MAKRKINSSTQTEEKPVEEVTEEVVTEEPEEPEVPEATVEENAKQNDMVEYKWIVDGETKVCEYCGSVLRGWAARQSFIYCPICGTHMTGR